MPSATQCNNLTYGFPKPEDQADGTPPACGYPVPATLDTLANGGRIAHNNSMKPMNPVRTIVPLLIIACLAAGRLSAGVVVVQNWTPVKITFIARASDGQLTRYTVTPTDIAAIPADGPVTIAFGEGAAAVTRDAAVNSIHYFGLREGKVDLGRLVLPGVDDKAEPGAKQPANTQAGSAQPRPPNRCRHSPGVLPAPGQPKPAAQPAPVYKIPVAILVDRADLRSREVWEKKLRKRLDDCSDIFEHHCRVRFEVVSVGIWQSNPAIHNFDDALTDFERKVPRGKARVAIGFTSRYDWVQDESHLGGTHGTLASHVLIREAVGHVSEPERLEVLVHEFGPLPRRRPHVGPEFRDAAQAGRPPFDGQELPHRLRRPEHAGDQPHCRGDADAASLASEPALAGGQDGPSRGLHGAGEDHSPGPRCHVGDRIAGPHAAVRPAEHRQPRTHRGRSSSCRPFRRPRATTGNCPSLPKTPRRSFGGRATS